jgi:hypothetical protein
MPVFVQNRPTALPLQTAVARPRLPMPTARAQMLPQQALPISQPPRQNMMQRLASISSNPNLQQLRSKIQSQASKIPMFSKLVPAANNIQPVPVMKKGGAVEKLKKMKKPIKRKSFKKADRVKKPAFKEGGAVERFLAKHPDYSPEG